MSNIVSTFSVGYKKDIILFLLSDTKCHFYFKNVYIVDQPSVNTHWKMTAIH